MFLKNFLAVISIVFASSLFLSPLNAQNQETLSLEDYLLQVRQQNLAIKASLATSESAEKKLAEIDARYSPVLFSQGQMAYDAKEAANPMQKMNHVENINAGVGLSKLSETGTEIKVGYNITNTRMIDASPQFFPNPKYFDLGPSIEFSHPLWGGSRSADVLSKSNEIQKEQVALLKTSETFKQEWEMTAAEGAYFRLVFAREMVKIALENRDRAQKLHAWTRKKVADDLTDASDAVQTKSLLKVRDLELTLASSEEKDASIAFNQSRGLASLNVKEVLNTPASAEELLARKLPTKGKRLDVKIAEQNIHLNRLAGELSLSKYDPTLDIFGMAMYNGHDTGFSNANKEVLELSRPTFVLGLKFAMPLMGNLLDNVRGSYAAETKALEVVSQEKVFATDSEWFQLETHLTEAKSRLKLLLEIEKIQKNKLTLEREKQKTGRSILFQVINYESEYAGAQINVLRTKAEITQIFARMKIFAASQNVPSQSG